jgi:hypothetical protein
MREKGMQKPRDRARNGIPLEPIEPLPSGAKMIDQLGPQRCEGPHGPQAAPLHDF